MDLTILERIHLTNLFPEKESYELMTAFKKLGKEINFDEEETRKYDIDSNTDKETKRYMITFNMESSHGYTKEFDFEPEVLSYLASKLKEKSESHELPEVMLSLYEKFVL